MTSFQENAHFPNLAYWRPVRGKWNLGPEDPGMSVVFVTN